MTFTEPAITREGRHWTLTTTQRLPLPRAQVFPFFADAMNLETITPPSVHFSILTPPPIEMRVGARIDYRLRVRGIPVRWRTLISAWEPPFRFVDEQEKGPYRLWVHEHTFEEQSDGSTLIRDTVRYDVPAGPLRPLINATLVAPDLRRIFSYRGRAIERAFNLDADDDARVATPAVKPALPAPSP